MRNFMKRISQAVARINLRYSKTDNGLYLFFKGEEGSKEFNDVMIASSVMQTYVLKKKNKFTGDYRNENTIRVDERQCKVISFSKDCDWILYIPNAASITDLDVMDTAVINPLSDFAFMTSLHTLNLIGTDVFGNVKELKECPFLRELKVSAHSGISNLYNKKVLELLPRNMNLKIAFEGCEANHEGTAEV